MPGSLTRHPLHLLDDLLNKHATWIGGHDVDVIDRDRLLTMHLDESVQENIDLMVLLFLQ